MSETLIAASPAEMLTAQNGLIDFCDARNTEARKSLSQAESVFNSLQKAGLNTRSASSLIRQSNKRIEFYEKLKAALMAGYYIIPPLPVHAFAVRTTKDEPPKRRSKRQWDNEMERAALPIGAGRFVSDITQREAVDSVEEIRNDKKVYNDIFENTDFGPMEFPLPARLVKPEIIDSVGKAMEERIFDAIGVIPSTRAADPITVGQIYHWKKNREPITFFISWWLDKNDL